MFEDPAIQAAAIATGGKDILADGGGDYAGGGVVAQQSLPPGTSVLVMRVNRGQVVVGVGGHYSPYGQDATQP